MRIMHLSDTHLDAVDGPNQWGFNASDSLRAILRDLRHVKDVDLVVVSGDVADDGSVAAYERARSLVGDFAAPHGAPVLYSTGNHDERGAFTQVLGNGHLGTEGTTDVVPTFPDDVAAASVVAGRRFVTLDSLVPGKGYGVLSRPQLDWLSDVLARPAERGTTLVFHHPPVTLDVGVQHALGLQDVEELVTVIEDSDVDLVLCGHFHQQILGTLASAQVWVTPGVVNRIDHVTGEDGTELAVRGASATLLDLDVPSAPLVRTVHARDPHVGEVVYQLDAERLSSVVASLGRST